MIKSRIALALAAAMFVATGSAFAAHAQTQNAVADAPGSAVIGTVESDVKVNGPSSQTQTGQSNQQGAEAGSIKNSAVIGDVKSKVEMDSLNQNQSGTSNKQNFSAGSIENSAVIGSVNAKVKTGTIQQDQSGQNNDQGMHFGTIH